MSSFIYALKCVSVCLAVAFFVFAGSAHAQQTASCPHRPPGPLTDRDVLILLYCATDGDNWTSKTNWLTNEPLNDWSGVTADVNDRVKILFIENNGLSGPIPASLGQLTALEELFLTSNELTGPIPTELGQLPALEFLFLANNELTGTIPPELRDLASLTGLNLSNNMLRGEIPPELENLANLKQLSLSRNMLSGEIPAELGQLTALVFLELWGNELTGTIPPGLGNLNSLTELSLSRNMLSGEIPAELGQLIALQYLYLWDNELTGTIPTELGDLTDLVELSLSRNMLSGEIPAELGQLIALQYLYLWDNELTGTIPTELGDLTILLELSLRDNQLTGQIPTQLGGLSSLQRLHLQRNRLSGSIPTQLGGLSSLQHLFLQNNQLTGQIPTQLGDLSSLSLFDLSDNQLSGSVPTDLENLPVLEEFGLWGNDDLMWDTISDELGKRVDRAVLWVLHDRSDGRNWKKGDGWLPFSAPLFSFSDWYGVTVNDVGRVAGLDLSNNDLSGEITNALEALDGLQTLNLSGNRSLGGTLPVGLMDLPGLQTANIQCTGIGTPTDADFQTWLGGIIFTGSRCPSFRPPAPPAPEPIDPSQDDMEELKVFYLETGGENWTDNTNWLNESEPLSQWYEVSVNSQGRVTGIDLSGNGLSGSVPPSLGHSVSELKTLDLSDNPMLTGMLPLSLMNLSELRILNMEGTGMCAPDDAEFRQWLGTISFQGNTCADDGLGLGALYLTTGGENWTDNTNWLNESEPLSQWYEVSVNSQGRVTGIDLSGNGLSGSVPPSLGHSVSELKTLDLSDNPMLTGMLPLSLMNLSELRILNMEDTGVCAPDDAEFRQWLETISFQGNTCADDGLGLGALYLTTGGENWTDNTNWLNESEPLSQWYEVSVNSQGRVTGIDLSGNGLSGSVPPSLGHSVSELKTLDLSDNPMLTGMLPLSLMNLSELRILNMEGTGMCAPDDAEFRQWLGTISFQGNTCADDGLGLGALYLTTGGENWTDNTNWLNESEPLSQWYEVSVNSQGRVTGIDLSGNGLSGSVPPSLGHSVSELKTLDLSDNPMLTGMLPLSLMNLSELRILNMEDTGVCAPDDAEFRQWLGTISFQGNTCADDGLGLGALYLTTGGENWTDNTNWLNESEPLSQWYEVSVNSQGRVTGIDLSGNGLSGSVPPSLGYSVSELKTLDLSDNPMLTGMLPLSLMNLSELRILNMEGTGMCAPDDAEFRQWLGTISFQGNTCADDGLGLGALYLTTGGENWTDNTNWLNESEPLSQWYEVSVNSQGRVTGIDLSGNGLSGSVPPSLGYSVSELKTLDLSDNPMLTGMLPLSLMNLSELRILNIEGTGMCAPDDAEFRQWLGTIDFQGDTCADDAGWGCSIASNGPERNTPKNAVLNLFLIISALIVISWRNPSKGRRI